MKPPFVWRHVAAMGFPGAMRRKRKREEEEEEEGRGGGKRRRRRMMRSGKNATKWNKMEKEEERKDDGN